MKKTKLADPNAPRCGLCGKTGKLTKTECCNQWICDDEDNYVLFSYDRSSCSRNHRLYTLCAYHHANQHPGRWQDCPKCREDVKTEMYVWYGTNEYNFEKLPNPPAFEPTRCARCNRVIHLGTDGYMIQRKQYYCDDCSSAEIPEETRQALLKAFSGEAAEPELTKPDTRRKTGKRRRRSPSATGTLTERLRALDRPELDDEWPDYGKLGIGPEHVPELIRLVTPPDKPAADHEWLRLAAHAWRALGAMHAVEAVAPLIPTLKTCAQLEDELGTEELPLVFGLLGPAAIPALEELLLDSDASNDARLAAGDGLEAIAFTHPDARTECVAALSRQLARFADTDVTFNGFVVINLVNLGASEALPLIEQAFAADRVDEFLTGDLDEVNDALLLDDLDEPELPETFELFSPPPRWEPPANEMASLPRKERRRIEREQAKTDRKQRKAGAAPKQPAPVYQLKITLEHSSPAIWRRFLVPGDIRLSELHDVIQSVMGWEDDHPHGFSVVGKTRRQTAPIDESDEPRARLSDAAPRKGSALLYEYDFGDSWRHRIQVERITESDDRYPGHPICLAGARACPPEDCGGIGGYENMLEVMVKPESREYEEVLDRLGPDFDPAAFNVAAVNHELAAQSKSS